MLVLAADVRRSTFIAPELEFLKLRNGHTKRIPDSVQSRTLSPFRSAGDLL